MAVAPSPATLSPMQWATHLLGWYAQHKRALPWRVGRDPYRIWLSEVILQQTRVAQGLPYYHHFVTTYPTVHALAAASEEEVLRSWQGLGYYRRARHLHACARQVVACHGGIFPTAYADLCKLPGIGPYTAAAIASIAHGEGVPVVDGNVYRVLARLLGLAHDITTPKGQRAFYEEAQRLLPAHDPGTYNEAIMEFGALQCTPTKPVCGACPVQHHCVAYHAGRVAVLPYKGRRVKVRRRYFHYFAFYDEQHLYLRRRGEQDVWAGLYDCYLVEHPTGLLPWHELDDPLVRLLTTHGVTLHGGYPVYQHLLTHQRICARFWHGKVTVPFLEAAMPHLHKAGVAPYPVDAVASLPKSKLMLRYLATKAVLLFGKNTLL